MQIRKPLLYPLSYGGMQQTVDRAPQPLSVPGGDGRPSLGTKRLLWASGGGSLCGRAGRCDPPAAHFKGRRRYAA